jgi:hypothetical protein
MNEQTPLPVSEAARAVAPPTYQRATRTAETQPTVPSGRDQRLYRPLSSR